MHSIGLNTKSVSRTKGGAEVKTKQKQETGKEKWEQALEHYEEFGYDQFEVEHYYWNEPCPRCGKESRILHGAPYCQHCHWDSLEDDTYDLDL